jgi:type IV pilus assembly protein PilA
MRRAVRHPAGEDGFTLIELLVVVVVLGVLVGIAVPVYLGFRSHAENTAAASNVRTAIPAAESYYASHADTYTGMDNTALQRESPHISDNGAEPRPRVLPRRSS